MSAEANPIRTSGLISIQGRVGQNKRIKEVKRQNSIIISRLLSQGFLLETSPSLRRKIQQLTEREGLPLKEIFKRFSTEEKNLIREEVGSNTLRHLLSISGEGDPSLFFSSLYKLGRRLEDHGQYRRAGVIYSTLIDMAAGNPVAKKARSRLEVMHGGGSVGERLEFLAGNFVEQATDPGLLAGMIVAGGLFRSVSARVLSSFVRPSFVHRALAFGAGFGAEVSGFTFTVRGIHEFQGREQDWSMRAVGRDLLATGMTLFALKSTGYLAHSIMARVRVGTGVPSSFVRFSEKALPQVAMYTGIVGAGGLEEHFGLRASSKHPMLDSLVTLLHFNVAGNLLSRLHGRSREGLFQPVEDLFSFSNRKMKWNLSGRLAGMKERLFPAFFLKTPITPEGVKASEFNIFMSSTKDPSEGAGRGKPLDLGGKARGEGASPKKEIPLFKSDPEIFLPIRDHLCFVGSTFFELYPRNESVLWFHPSHKATLQYKIIIEMIRGNIHCHPRSQEFSPVLKQISREIDNILSTFASAKRGTFSSNHWEEVREFIKNMSRFQNIMLSFLITPSVKDLQAALQKAHTANDHLERVVGRSDSLLPSGDIADKLSARTFFDSSEPGKNGFLQPYDYSNSLVEDMVEIPGVDRKVLIVGNVFGLRPFPRDRQQVRILTDGSMASLSWFEPWRDYRKLVSDLARLGEADYEYLEGYDIVSREALRGKEGERLLSDLLFPLRPGGIGYLVVQDPLTFRRVIEILTENDMADIISGAQNAPLPVYNYRSDKGNSNHIFFRKVPYR